MLTVEFHSSCHSNVMSDARLTAVSPAQLVSNTGKVINSMLYKHRLFAIISVRTSAFDTRSNITFIWLPVKFMFE